MKKQQHTGPCDFAEGAGIKAGGEWEGACSRSSAAMSSAQNFTVGLPWGWSFTLRVKKA
jgi:hypothetical protein